MSKLTLYRHALSGHSHRVEVFLSILGLKADIIDIDLMNGEHKKPEFLKKNIFGQVPVLENDTVTISDSNAILSYLATKYDASHSWLPIEATKLAEVRNVSLEEYPNIQAWLKRFEVLPGFIPMQATKIGLAA